MHPDDVAELVAAEFADLQAELGRQSALPVTSCELMTPNLIHVRFVARQLASEVVPDPSALAVASGMGLVGDQVQFGFQARGIRVPILGQDTQRELVLALGCDNWDGQPPTAELLLPNGTPLPANEWPHDSTDRGIVFGHPDYDRKFFCRPGLREYHTHPVHRDDAWDQHREGMSLSQLAVGLLDDLAHRWKMAAA